MKHLHRLAGVVLLTGGLVLGGTEAAGAHSADSSTATNYLTELTSVRPPVEGVDIKILEAGNQIEFRNDQRQEAIIQGYDDEPYLRISNRGVYENQNSRATYFNRDRLARVAVPANAVKGAKPVWKKVSDEPVARWHDHRIHWMGVEDPPKVEANRDKEVMIYPDWQIPFRVGTTSATIHGTLRWIPPVAPTSSVTLAVGAFLVGVGVLLLGHSLIVSAALVVLLITIDMIHNVGIAFATTESFGGKLLAIVTTNPYAVIAWIAGLLGVVLLVSKKAEGYFPALFAAVVIVLVGGIADVQDLTRSQLTFVGPASLLRAVVAISLGLGVSTAIVCFLGIRRFQNQSVTTKAELTETS